ncbi:beta-ketoacyl-ACP synthase III [Anaerosporobacter faecicola]|uniref:beta-ketoacyl-ACP synthase III n=1 Tax=Anaerosporobacter faecicola TaxID=2718714 RepID=UPI00143892EF|nr:beta-ketoacyl-ACP synthase III [Anaerosporobacter faecicola]
MEMRFVSTGSYLPEQVVDNDFLSRIVDTSDEWISSRTGIRQRRVVTAGEGTACMAAKAATKAITRAGIDPQDIDLILVATMSPDNYLPNTACEVQAEIGAVNAVCYDLSAACTGFIYALNTAYAFIKAGIYKTVLIIGSEVLSKMLDWNDRSTCVLFGDGAGAAIVQATDIGLFESILGSDGKRKDALTCASRYIVNPLVSKAISLSDKESLDYVRMEGQEVFKFVVKTIPGTIQQVIEKAGCTKEEIRYYVLHQANQRILESVAKKLKEPIEKFPMNLDKYGNTSSASIPILLDKMNKKNKLNRGDKIILSGFGGGLTWGTTLIEW